MCGLGKKSNKFFISQVNLIVKLHFRHWKLDTFFVIFALFCPSVEFSLLLTKEICEHKKKSKVKSLRIKVELTFFNIRKNWFKNYQKSKKN